MNFTQPIMGPSIWKGVETLVESDTKSSGRIRKKRIAKSTMTSGNVEYSPLWFIENHSYCGVYSVLDSPEFTFQGLEGSSWSVQLFPKCQKPKDCPYSVILQRKAQNDGPENLSLKVEMSIMKADGSTLYSEASEHEFSKLIYACVFEANVNMEELFVRGNTEFLPGDSLCVRCRMWRGEGCVESVEQCTARTRIGIEQVCFTHRVKHFSTLRLNERRILFIPSHSKAGGVYTSYLSLLNASANDETRNDEFVSVSIKASDRKYWLRRLKLSLLDVSGNTTKCAEVDYRFYDKEQQVMNRDKSFTRNFILSKREECLPNDELSFLCEYTFATGEEHMKIEKQLHDIPMEVYNNIFYNACTKEDSKTAEECSAPPSASEGTEVHYNDQRLTNAKLNEKAFPSNSSAPSTVPFVAQNHMTNNDPYKSKCSITEKLSKCPSALDDFKTLCSDQLFSDIVLKTATESFPAHKSVLCARSSVFRAMLTNDMRERNSNCIRVDDLDDVTVERLLLFLYSDHLEELRWGSALGLYYAADKYAIERLKVLCSSFLVDNLSTSNAVELLLLADTHSDAELKQSVEDFIFEHEVEVFGSGEWEKFSETNPQLAIKTVNLKYKRKLGGK